MMLKFIKSEPHDEMKIDLKKQITKAMKVVEVKKEDRNKVMHGKISVCPGCMYLWDVHTKAVKVCPNHFCNEVC